MTPAGVSGGVDVSVTDWQAVERTVIMSKAIAGVLVINLLFMERWLLQLVLIRAA